MKKDLNYYMNLNYPMVITQDTEEGGYCVSFPDLPGCLTCCDKFDEIQETANEAKKAWLSASLEDGHLINEPRNLTNV